MHAYRPSGFLWKRDRGRTFVDFRGQRFGVKKKEGEEVGAGPPPARSSNGRRGRFGAGGAVRRYRRFGSSLPLLMVRSLFIDRQFIHTKACNAVLFCMGGWIRSDFDVT